MPYLDLPATEAADLFRRGEQGMAISVLEYDPDEERMVTTGRVILSTVHVSEDGRSVIFGGVHNGVYGRQRVVESVGGSQMVRAYLS